MNRRRRMALLSVSTGVLLVAAWIATTGCASHKKKVETAPTAAEAAVEQPPAVPDRIDTIEVRPWSVRQGESVEFVVTGTAGRSVRVLVEPVGGGAERTVPLRDDGNGRYVAHWPTPEDLPAGRYRVVAEMTETASGAPVRLTATRTLTVTAAAHEPTRADCERARDALAGTLVHFAFDRSDLDEEAMAILDRVAEEIAGVRTQVRRLTIVGHCDSRGTIEYNLALGARRAAAVRDALAGRSALAGLRIETLSMGEEQPLIPNARTEAEHAQNRRAEFRLDCGD